MAKMKNQRIYSRDHEWLKMLADEQRDYIGRHFSLDLKAGCLTIFALPPRKNKKKRADEEKPEHKDRNKREEKFERRA